MKYIITKKRNISNQFHDRVKKIIVLCGFILLIVLTSCSEDNGNDDSYEHIKKQAIDIWNIYLKEIDTVPELTNVKVTNDSKDNNILFICYSCKNTNDNISYYVCATNNEKNGEWRIIDQYNKQGLDNSEIYEKVLYQINNNGNVLEISIEEFD